MDVNSQEVYYTSFGFIFLAPAIGSTDYDNPWLTKVIFEIWEHNNFFKNGSNGETNMSGHYYGHEYAVIIKDGWS